MTDVLGMLAMSGPLSIEDVVWKAGDSPGDALQQIVNMAAKGLVAVNGVSVDQLRNLEAEVRQDQPQGVDAALSRIHAAFANQPTTIELTTDGLKTARFAV